MLDWYDIVSRYYAAGYYSKDDVKIFVSNGKITAAQYQEIVGIAYE